MQTINGTDYFNAAIDKINSNFGETAPKASPALTGTPTAPTSSKGDNSTKVATTAYVDRGLTDKLDSDAYTAADVLAKVKTLDGSGSGLDADTLDGQQASAFAAASHGNHVPTPQTANNAKFLRNDNSWQVVTPENIGAAAASHGHALTEAGVTGTLSVAKGGTGASTAAEARTALGAAQTVTYTATLAVAWTGDAPPYTQNVVVTGILEADVPTVDVVLSDTTETAIEQLEAWGSVSRIDTANGSFTATCLQDKPTVAIPLQLKVVR